jgi:hypothetical protein
MAGEAVGVKGPRVKLPRPVLGAAAAALDAVSFFGVPLPAASGPALRALGVYLYFDGKKSREELGLRPAPLRQVLEETAADLRARGRIR